MYLRILGSVHLLAVWLDLITAAPRKKNVQKICIMIECEMFTGVIGVDSFLNFFVKATSCKIIEFGIHNAYIVSYT